MEITNRIEKLVNDFNSFDDWEDRYRQIINFGKKLAPLPEEYRVEANKVKGCQSQVWLFAEINEDKTIKYFADSDASITKGIVALLLEIYTDIAPDEILQTKTDFIDDLGLRQHLSMNRSNGLNAMLKQIQLYALALKTKMSMGI
jgi:cysteine desulfuration protein SufE